MRVKSFLLLTLVCQSVSSMDAPAAALPNENHGYTTVSMMIKSLKKVGISGSTSSRTITKPPSEMTLQDILAEPLSKDRVLKIEPWCNAKTKTMFNDFFEIECDPLRQTNYRALRNGIAAALYAGVPPSHKYMAWNFSTVVSHNDITLVKLMLNNKVDGINTIVWNRPPLFFASTPEMAKTLTKYGAPLGQKVNGRNLLHNALRLGYDPKLVFYYLKQRINAEEPDDQNLSALDYFTKYKSSYPYELARKYLTSFIRAGILADHPFIKHHFIEAIEAGDEELVEIFLDNYVDPNLVVNNQSAISYATNTVMACILQEWGAAIDIHTEQGNLIHNVLKKKYDSELIPYYAEQGVPLDARDIDGLTPVDYFCTHDYPDEKAHEYIEAFLYAGISEDTIEKTLRTHLPSSLRNNLDETSSDNTTSSTNTSVNSSLELPHD